jgi:predicted transcriptional regulator
MDDKHKLTSTELLVLVQLVGTWWRTNDLPFPALSTIAARCGVSTRQVQRSINRLEKLGFIRRINRRTKGFMANNAYDLAPLVKLLNEVAKAFPNPYPRSVDKAAVEALAASLEASKTDGEVAKIP